MRRFHFLGIVLLAPALAVMAAGLGCSGGNTKDGGGGGGTDGGAKDDGSKAGGERTAVEGKGLATLKGKVTYDGTAPKPATLLAEIEKQNDRDHCKKGDTNAQTWKVKDGAVANVVVWIKAPGNKFFKLPADTTSLQDKFVEIDQPFCAFEPHVSLLFPSYYDATTKGRKATGQKLKIKNSAPMPHNTRIGGSSLTNASRSETLPTKTERVLDIKLDTQVITLNCDFHKWMTGFAWTFEHPFAAVSKGDRPKDEKEYGMYEIDKIPAGVPLEVWVWHEAQPSFSGDGKSADGKANGVKLTEMKLNEGDNTLDIKVKAK